MWVFSLVAIYIEKGRNVDEVRGNNQSDKGKLRWR